MAVPSNTLEGATNPPPQTSDTKTRMPTLETPPNPAPHPPPDRADQTDRPQPLKVSAGRFGELDHTELVHLLDSLDDDRSRSRFRESIYLSVIFYLALAWFIFYGPKVLFHQGHIINPADVLKQRDKELTYLNVPKDFKVPPPKDSKAISEHNARAQTAHPTLDKKTLEQLQAMRKAGAPGASAPAPRPLPDSPQPQPAAAQPPAPQPQPQPKPQPPAPPQPSIPDAPKPATQPGRPNFSTPSNPGDAIRQAADAAARTRGTGGDFGANAPARHPGMASGAEVLSDTQGVDFGPYIKRLLRMIQAQWEPLIPEECYPPLNKEGQTSIRFVIQPNGVVSFMHLDARSGDQAIDKAAWGGINAVGQMPRCPRPSRATTCSCASRSSSPATVISRSRPWLRRLQSTSLKPSGESAALSFAASSSWPLRSSSSSSTAPAL